MIITYDLPNLGYVQNAQKLPSVRNIRRYEHSTQPESISKLQGGNGSFTTLRKTRTWSGKIINNLAIQKLGSELSTEKNLGLLDLQTTTIIGTASRCYRGVTWKDALSRVCPNTHPKRRIQTRPRPDDGGVHVEEWYCFAGISINTTPHRVDDLSWLFVTFLLHEVVELILHIFWNLNLVSFVSFASVSWTSYTLLLIVDL